MDKASHSEPESMIPDLIPPQSLMQKIGASGIDDYQAVSHAFFNIFVRYGGIKPTDRVLDVGCGCGRMAMPLTRYLTTGSYEGLDVSADLIEWCQKNIAAKLSNFRFQWANLANSVYNPAATNPASSYKFPYPDQEFDFAFLTSVFTHMLPDDVELYMREIARTLKQDGTAVATFFILNEESERLMKTHPGPLSFDHSYANTGVRVQSPTYPEDAVAYPEATVRSMLEQSALTPAQPIHFGSWCGRTATVTYQDLIILNRHSRWQRFLRFLRLG
jgi:ubiquinone/menaquinone biosynthesis C-methylase UbiE